MEAIQEAALPDENTPAVPSRDPEAYERNVRERLKKIKNAVARIIFRNKIILCGILNMKLRYVCDQWNFGVKKTEDRCQKKIKY